MTLGRLVSAERYKGFDEVLELLPSRSTIVAEPATESWTAPAMRFEHFVESLVALSRDEPPQSHQHRPALQPVAPQKDRILGAGTIAFSMNGVGSSCSRWPAGLAQARNFCAVIALIDTTRMPSSPACSQRAPARIPCIDAVNEKVPGARS